mmetsp:Transcript_24136/g.60064  ORF Transcript_24136/g.60064 Transcript_24136/m.60064 type:complete len:269 (-) Transcript_24136:936-1742(-)
MDELSSGPSVGNDHVYRTFRSRVAADVDQRFNSDYYEGFGLYSAPGVSESDRSKNAKLLVCILRHDELFFRHRFGFYYYSNPVYSGRRRLLYACRANCPYSGKVHDDFHRIPSRHHVPLAADSIASDFVPAVHEDNLWTQDSAPALQLEQIHEHVPVLQVLRSGLMPRAHCSGVLDDGSFDMRIHYRLHDSRVLLHEVLPGVLLLPPELGRRVPLSRLLSTHVHRALHQDGHDDRALHNHDSVCSCVSGATASSLLDCLECVHLVSVR